MKKQLINTIQLIDEVNDFLNRKDSEFDSADVIDTFQLSKERLSKFLYELKEANLDDKENINKLMVYIELEYSNLVWSFQEIRAFINRTLVKYPD